MESERRGLNRVCRRRKVRGNPVRCRGTKRKKLGVALQSTRYEAQMRSIEDSLVIVPKSECTHSWQHPEMVRGLPAWRRAGADADPFRMTHCLMGSWMNCIKASCISGVPMVGSYSALDTRGTLRPLMSVCVLVSLIMCGFAHLRGGP